MTEKPTRSSIRDILPAVCDTKGEQYYVNMCCPLCLLLYTPPLHKRSAENTDSTEVQQTLLQKTIIPPVQRRFLAGISAFLLISYSSILAIRVINPTALSHHNSSSPSVYHGIFSPVNHFRNPHYHTSRALPTARSSSKYFRFKPASVHNFLRKTSSCCSLCFC